MLMNMAGNLFRVEKFMKNRENMRAKYIEISSKMHEDVHKKKLYILIYAIKY